MTNEPFRHTKYANLTEQELVQHCEVARNHSPLIEELCQRLELRGLRIDKNANHNVSCPVCEAELLVDYNEGNDMFELRVQE